MIYKYFFSLFLIFLSLTVNSKELKIVSPNGNLEAIINTQPNLTFDIFNEGELIVSNVEIGMNIKDYGLLHKNLHFINASYSAVNEKITPVFSYKNKQILNNYQQVILDFEENLSIEFRLFNNGLAYRFILNFNDNILIKDELLNFTVNKKGSVFAKSSNDFFSGNESTFDYYPNNILPKHLLINCPALFFTNDTSEQKFFITESNVHDYPGMSLDHLGKGKFNAVFPKVVRNINEPEKNELQDYSLYFPTKNENFISATKGSRELPWRIFGVSNSDKDLISNQLVYLLAEDKKIKDCSWIKPGKYIWDKWHNLNLIGVNFKVGRNTNTYLYYIDFAENFGIDYITIDSGWYQNNNPLKAIESLDIADLCRYSQEKKIGLFVNVSFPDLIDDFHGKLKTLKEWGVVGIKIDQILREDQTANNLIESIISTCADLKLLVVLHDFPKPAGLERTYPNLLSMESVAGLAYDKVDGQFADPEQAVILPYSRMLCGPMDYAPGALNNATKDDYRVNSIKPMSLGTRCQQLGMYIIYETGMQSLSDSPSSYELEIETLEFINTIPVQWDTTIVLAAKVGNYIIEAKKYKDQWYIGGLNDWTPREVNIDFSFLPKGSFEMTIFKDGVNAYKNATDYKKEVLPINNKKISKLYMAPGGGFCAKIITKGK